jgi:hypothetical protein
MLNVIVFCDEKQRIQDVLCAQKSNRNVLWWKAEDILAALLKYYKNPERLKEFLKVFKN